MASLNSDRRDFLKTSLAALATSSMPYWYSPSATKAFAADSPNERPVLGCIGTGDRWNAVGPNAMKFADCVAVCDVDSAHTDKAVARVKEIQSKKGSDQHIQVEEDYHKILERDDIDIVTIVTTDHWHTKIAIDAMRAGKDVYCEKPLTLTIEEGKQIIKVLEETGRVFQVGTQQRSEMGLRFLQAIALIRDGRIGDVKSANVVIGTSPTGGPFETSEPPSTLNWERWLGQAPMVPFITERCHYEFRWWYEYSGGKMTDWGAHHVDIAQWAMGLDKTGPTTIEGTGEHPCDMVDGYPTCDNKYNVAHKFNIRCDFDNGMVMNIMDTDVENDIGNGILFTGTEGRFLVSRGKLAGAPVEELETKPLPDGLIQEIYKGKEPGDHMRNFIECVKSREQPISDVWTHHRAISTCHLANIAIRLGRKIQWDPEAEQIVGDDEARAMQAREQRKGYEIDVPV